MFPSSYLIHRLPSAKYLCSCSLGWSAMALLMPACKSWSALMAVRFLMGRWNCSLSFLLRGPFLIIVQVASKQLLSQEFPLLSQHSIRKTSSRRAMPLSLLLQAQSLMDSYLGQWVISTPSWPFGSTYF